MSREGGTLAFSVPKLPGFLSFRKEPLPCPPPCLPCHLCSPVFQMETQCNRQAGDNTLLRIVSALSLWTHTYPVLFTTTGKPV